jgi:succinate dehydrogenase/fumarate reductase flavoprotein subunit
MGHEDKANKGLSRRGFIKGASVGLGAVALVGASSQTAGAVQANRVRRWDERADVVVLGTGAAGLVAAIVAHDLGAKVLILEKAPEAHAGGNSRVAGQGFWSPVDFDQAVQYEKGLNGGFPVPDTVVEAFQRYAVQNEAWYNSVGGEGLARTSIGEIPELPGAKGSRFVFPKTGPGFERFWKVLKDNAMKRKIRIMYQMAGTDLIQEAGTKEIRGVVANGKNIRANRAVVLCTGGFENNQQMIRDYLQMPCGYPKGTPYNTGDGIRMAMAVGADLWHMSNQAGPDLNFKAPGAEWAFGYRFSPAGNGWIWVAKDATRFANEMYDTKHGKIPFHGTYVPLPTPLPVHVVFDETTRKAGPLYSPRSFFCWHAIIEHYEWSKDNGVELSKGWIVQADTITELATKIGKTPEILEKTVANWNAACSQGSDMEFRRPSEKMMPIASPPYYAMELVPAFTNTQGGPRRNSLSQVMDTAGKPIPRLYSAGEMGSVFSYLYQGSGNLGECIAFGRIAAENAAKEKPWV